VTDANVFPFVHAGIFAFCARGRAQLAETVEIEAAGLLAEHADKRTDDGRNGWCGAHRLCSVDDRIRFTSAILPPDARRSKMEVLIPVLYLKGISTPGWRKPGTMPRQLRSLHRNLWPQIR
jgi:hypothetical protein